MIRNGGALGGVRILAPRTVALMTHNQIGDLHSTTAQGSVSDSRRPIASAEMASIR